MVTLNRKMTNVFYWKTQELENKIPILEVWFLLHRLDCKLLTLVVSLCQNSFTKNQHTVTRHDEVTLHDSGVY